MGGRRLKKVETIFISKSGSRIHAEGTISPRVDNGKVIATQGFFRDVTERKKSKDLLEASRERYKTIYNSTGYSFMVATPDEGFLSCNKATLKMFGCRTVHEFTSRTPADLSPEYQPDGQLSTLQAQKMMKTALTNASLFFEWTHKKLSGSEFPVTFLLN